MSEDQSPQPAPKKLASSENSRSWWKSLLIKVLRFLIGVLEGLVSQLEAEAPAPSPVSLQAERPSLDSTTPAPQSATLWQKLLQPIRSRLPASVNNQVSDPILTGIVGVAVVLVISLVLNLGSGQPPKQVAVISEVPAPSPETVAVPAPGPEIAPEPLPESLPEPLPVPLDEPLDEPLPELERPVVIVPDLTTPAMEQPLKLVPPEPKLSPEQYLIASIQNEITHILETYGGGVVESLKVNFLASSLQVKVSNNWYQLNENQQNRLANDMLKQAQELDFIKLEIRDIEGQLIARSPVVGSEMIIVQRRLLSSSLEEV